MNAENLHTRTIYVVILLLPHVTSLAELDCCYHYYVLQLRQRNEFAWFGLVRFRLFHFLHSCVCVCVTRVCSSRLAYRLHNITRHKKIKMKKKKVLTTMTTTVRLHMVRDYLLDRTE